jgi:hypothetical protein
MGGEKGGDGFDFENDGVFDHDVGAKTRWDRYLFVNHGHGEQGYESDAGMAQFQGHALGVDRFQRPGPTMRWTSMAKPMILSVRAWYSSMKNSRGAPWSSVFSVVKTSKA